VVTVEVGPEGARTWLVLGVTGQSITCLHTLPAASSEVPHAQLPR
jgi:flagellar protein FliO/FliZ